MYYFKKFQKREIGVIKRKQPQTTAKEVQKTANNRKKSKKDFQKPHAPSTNLPKFFFKGEVKNNS